ncbi:hypothetical protein LTR92_006055 [Exophiala xenobiotica]|nr:hypothetical protein LTR92_006055 [Exophiala xenobiotica]
MQVFFESDLINPAQYKVRLFIDRAQKAIPSLIPHQLPAPVPSFSCATVWQEVTFFSSQQIQAQADPSTSVPGNFVFPQLQATMMASSITSPTSSWAPANHSVCRRNSLTTPVTSPQQASFMMPTSPLFIRTPERAYFQAASSTTAAAAAALKSMGLEQQDGRQSRMAMRSPPNVDRVLNLPLRVNTSLYNKGDAPLSEPMASISEDQDQDQNQDQDQQPSPSFSDAATLTMMDWTPTSPPSSSHLKRIARPHVPTPILTRSPIRKRPRVRIHLPPPPHYHMVISETSLSPTSLRTRVQHMHSVEHLRAPLVPLISVTNGLPHPSFPTTLLQYHLLTHEQLDCMARWYHQVDPPLDETFMYPAWIPAWTSMHPGNGNGDSSAAHEGEGDGDGDGDGDVDLETKRRRFGRFIGLRGCESPASTGPEGESPDELARRMEREWKRAIERAEDDERAWEKSWRGRW